MNIRDVQSGALRPSQLRSGSAGEAGAAAAVTPAQAAQQQPADASQDSIELSTMVRTAPEDAQRAQELAFARKAMLSAPPLDEKRVGDILQRIQEGFYSQPDVLKKISEKFAAELTGGAV